MERKNLFYSRQSAAIGLKTQTQLQNLRVFIYGLNSMGFEILKNLSLFGVQSIGFYDPNPVSHDDKYINFFYEDQQKENQKYEEGKNLKNDGKSIQLTRGDSAKKNYAHLNPNVILIDFPCFQNFEQVLNNFDIVVFSSTFDKNMLLKINSYCRANSKGFIYGGGLGIMGFIFLDFGSKFLVEDKDGKEEKSYFIRTISQNSDHLKIELYENDEIILEKGNLIKINGISCIEGKIFEIKNIFDGLNILVGGQLIENFNIPESHNATIKIMKESELISFGSLQEGLVNPKLKNLDFNNKNESASLHLVLSSILEFYEQNGKKPKIDDLSEVQYLMEELNLRNICNEYDNDDIRLDLSSDFNENLLKKALLFLETDFPPIGIMLGAIISQEIIKFTRKFVPLKNWFFYNFNEKLLNDELQMSPLSNNPYEAILGKNVYDLIKKQRIFMVGCGALGCEYMRNFSSMNISENNQGEIILMDDDTIEYSNLNRQYLYKPQDLNRFKAETLKNACLNYNKSLKITAFNEKLEEESNINLSDEFFDNIDFIFSGVDNIKARNLLQKKSIFYEKIFFDAGTLGLDCNFYQFIPFRTCTLDDLPKPKMKQTPVCTIHNHPYKIEHMIEWAKMALFENIFIQKINNLRNFITNRNLEEILNDHEKINQNIYFSFLDVLITKKIQELVKIAKEIFKFFFIDNILLITHSMPKDFKDDKGEFFWKGDKIFPNPLKENFILDENQSEFIFFTTKIFSHIFKIDFNIFFNSEEWKTLLDKEIEINISSHKLDHYEIYEQEIKKLKFIQYEKDDVIIGYNDFIASAATLRSFNYGMEKVSVNQAKQVAGNLTPALSSTTSLIVAWGILEFIKTIYNNYQIFSSKQDIKLEFYKSLNLSNNRNISISLKDSNFNLMKLIPFKKIKEDLINMVSYVYPICSWDKLYFSEISNIDSLIKRLNEEFPNSEIFTINSGRLCFYSSMMENEIEPAYLKQDLISLFPVHDKIVERRYLSISCLILKEQNILATPEIKLILK